MTRKKSPNGLWGHRIWFGVDQGTTPNDGLFKTNRNSKVEVSKTVAAPGSFWQKHREASHKPFTFWKLTTWKHRHPMILCKSLAFHFKCKPFLGDIGICCKTFLGSDDGVPGGLDCALLVRESFSLVLSLQEARDKRQDFEKVAIKFFQTSYGLRDEGWKVGWWCLMHDRLWTFQGEDFCIARTREVSI